MTTHWVADLGNRYLKIAEIVDDELQPRHVLRATADAIDDADFSPRGGPTGPVVYASVNPKAAPRWERWLRDRWGVDAVQLGRDRPFPIESRADGAGADRLVNAIAAHARCGPRGAIVADVGTATTIDAVAPDGTFLGGAILPGPHLQARALGEHGAQLFVVEPTAPPTPIGTNTADALRSGVFHGAVGAIAAVIDRIERALPFTPRLLVTGGDAPPLIAALPGAELVPALTLEGVWIAAGAGRD